MKGIKVPKFGKTIVKAVSKNKSTILVILGLVGLGGTVVVTAKYAPKVQEDIDKEKLRKFLEKMKANNVRIVEEEELDDIAPEDLEEIEKSISEGKAVKKINYKGEKLTFFEIVKVSGKHVLPILLLVIITGGCNILAHHIDAKTIAGLGAFVAASKKNEATWIEEAKKKLDPEAYQEIEDNVAEKAADDAMISDDDLEPGQHWIYDAPAGKYFPATELEIKEAFVDARDTVNNKDGELDWATLMFNLHEDRTNDIQDFFEKFYFVKEKHRGMPYDLRKIPGTDRFILTYDDPLHYKEIGKSSYL